MVAKKNNRHQRNWYSNQLILSTDKSLTTETSENKSIRSHTKKELQRTLEKSNRFLLKNHSKSKFEIPEVKKRKYQIEQKR